VSRALPDMKFIREQVSITQVAVYLGIRLATNTSAHCWRTSQHQNGDRTPSVGFKRNRIRCFVCDGKSMSVIDLVQAHEACDLVDAVKWICDRFDVPNVPKNKKLFPSQRWHVGRVGAAHFPLEGIVLSGLWADFDDATRAILPVLCRFADSLTGEIQLSYRAIARYSGKRSDRTIAFALKRLQQLGVLTVARAKNGLFRECGRYQFDWDNKGFQSLLKKCDEQTRAEADGEKALRAQARIHRSRSLFTAVKSEESSHFSRGKHAIEPAIEPNSLEKSSRFTTVQRQHSEIVKPTEVKNSPAWEPPTFMDLRWPEDAAELAVLGLRLGPSPVDCAAWRVSA
jgi:hypothetical protein